MSSALKSRRRSPLGGLFRWLDAMPHPRWVCEIKPNGVAAAHSARGRLAPEDFALEPLAPGSLAPSPVELNVVLPDNVRSALRAVFGRLDAEGEEVALLLPDQAVRVFLVQFERLPRRADEAVPLIRWRLKKSVPYDVEETVVSYTPQAAKNGGLEVLVALARTRIVRQYEELVEAAGMIPGMVVGSTLAALPLVEDDRPSLVARLSGTTLTAIIVRGDELAVYRSTEMASDIGHLPPQDLVEEIYPVVAYYQDSHGQQIEHIYLAGVGGRFDAFRQAVQGELPCGVTPLLASGAIATGITGEARALAERHLEPLVGWMSNRGA